MQKDTRLWTFGEAARELKVSQATVADLARINRLKPKRVPHNGNAKGLDSTDMAVLRHILSRDKNARSSPSESVDSYLNGRVELP